MWFMVKKLSCLVEVRKIVPKATNPLPSRSKFTVSMKTALQGTGLRSLKSRTPVEKRDILPVKMTVSD